MKRTLIAVDTGGTFTDAVSLDLATGRIGRSKVLTDNADLARGILQSVDDVDVDLASATTLKHGTTQVINALLQRDGARTALVTTKGFRDVMAMRRGNRPIAFDLDYSPNPPLVPRDLCFEVDERLDPEGRVVRPLDESDLERIAVELRGLGVQSVAISFINSYANDEHEVRARRRLSSLLPGVWVTTGTEASREWYEYERTATAVANAYVAPRVSRYVGNLETRLACAGFEGEFYLMASHGGVVPAEQAVRQPTTLVESGPIGGVIGASAFARVLGVESLLAFDMGGTTAKCAIVQEGTYDVVPTYYVGGYVHGFPVRARVLDILEVGSGGSSIARVDSTGRMSVGPESAGSSPGPVAFGRGGSEPTVTDANLVLGRIAPGSFLNGEVSLNIQAARKALDTWLGDPLGYRPDVGTEDVARGVIRMASITMAAGVKRVLIDRGFDARATPMFVFGGGGPLHAVQLAEEVGANEVIVPPFAGNFSAVGMLMSDARLDDVRTFSRLLGGDVLSDAEPLFVEMESSSVSALDVSGDVRVQRFIGLRFVGQRHELNIPIDRAGSVTEIRDRFVRTYAKRYGHASNDSQVEVTVLRVATTAGTEHLTPDNLATWLLESTADPVAPRDTRRVVFDAGAASDVPVYAREVLPAAWSQSGPVVVEEYGSTTLVPPGWSVTVGQIGELWITRD